MISNLRQDVRFKEGFGWILGIILCFQEIEYLIETLFRSMALSHSLL